MGDSVVRKRRHFVSVVGNIGVGKTTFAEIVAKTFGWAIFYEKVVDNPYLPDYYEDMSKWSFHLQIYFLKERFKEQMEIAQSSKSCIQDRSIFEDPEIFAYVLNQQGHLSDREYETYLDLFEQIVPFLPQPDLFIYLKANTWTLLSRIRKRGREFEMGITSEFLHQLNMAYSRWITRLKQEKPVMIIETDSFDIEKDKNRLDEILLNLKRSLKI